MGVWVIVVLVIVVVFVGGELISGHLNLAQMETYCLVSSMGLLGLIALVLAGVYSWLWVQRMRGHD